MKYKAMTDYRQRNAVTGVMRDHYGEAGKQVVDDLANAEAALAARDAMIKELVDEGDYLVKFAETRSGREGWADMRAKALALIDDTPNAKQGEE